MVASNIQQIKYWKLSRLNLPFPSSASCLTIESDALGAVFTLFECNSEAAEGVCGVCVCV